MHSALRKRWARTEESGFTLIELMVVVLIIAILIAIAIPTFLGARQRAQDRASQSNIRNAFTTEKTYYTDNQSYGNSAAVQPLEPSLAFTDGIASASANNVYIDTAGLPSVVYVSALSASGQCFYIKDTAGAPGTQYYKAASPCVAPSTVALGSWTTSW